MYFFFLALIFGDQIILLNEENVTQHALSSFDEIAKIDRVIKLESSSEGLLGFIDHVVYDKDHSRIYVGDYNATGAIKVFSTNGKYLKNISQKGQGPGEFRSRLQSFSMLKDGTLVVLTTTHLQRFDADGKLIREIALPKFMPLHMEAIGQDIFVNTGLIREGDFATVYRFNDQLKRVGSFGTFDKRKNTYRYFPPKTLATLDHHLWVSKLYGPELSVYDRQGKLVRQFVIPQKNEDTLSDLWNTENFTEDIRRGIKKHMHRFLQFFPFDSGMLAFDYAKFPERHYRMLYITPKGRIDAYSGYHLLNSRYMDKTLTFRWVAGITQNGLIGVFEYDDHHEKIAELYPQIKDQKMAVDDNPLLVLFSPR